MKMNKLRLFFQENRILIVFFLFFVVIYLINFENYTNKVSTDYAARYKLYGLKIITDIINWDFKSYFYLFGSEQFAFINSYFFPELVTGFLLQISSKEIYFFVISNIINMILLFSSFYFFFNTLIDKEKEGIMIIFFIFFFSYSANWIWCFWKIADIYFLFIFSLVFYYLNKGLERREKKFFIYSFIFTVISLFTKPQGFAVLPFYILSIYLIYYKRNFNFYKFIFISFIIYLILFPLTIFYFKQTGNINILVIFFSEGNINGKIFYKYEEFLTGFSLQKSNLSEILYFYYLFIKKIIYQLTFIRETYSLKHNIFLIFYTLSIYFFIFINLDYFLKKREILTKQVFLITFFSILMHSSLNTAMDPNRHQLFNLVPLYILVSISIFRIYDYYKKIIFEN